MRIRKNKMDVALEVLCLLLLLGTTIYMLAIWSSVPDQIPSHYNMAGEIDGWSSKGEIWFFIGIMYLVYILLTVVEQFPQTWNTGVSVTPANSYRVYRALKYMLETLKLLIVGLFSVLTLFMVTCNPLSGWMIAVFAAVLLGDVIFWLVRVSLIKNR